MRPMPSNALTPEQTTRHIEALNKATDILNGKIQTGIVQLNRIAVILSARLFAVLAGIGGFVLFLRVMDAPTPLQLVGVALYGLVYLSAMWLFQRS